MNIELKKDAIHMSAKSKIIEMLEKNRGNAVSGERLAEEAGVTRAAVWKIVKSLCDEGYSITSRKNKGYMLEEKSTGISEEGIALYLSETGCYEPSDADFGIFVFDEIDSTQNFGKKLAVEGKLNRALVTADSQTAGRGRYGKSFYSPGSTGIYMSLVIRVDRDIKDFISITFATAVAVARVIERHSDLKPMIKWVNDIYIHGGKAVGILTEGLVNMEEGGLDKAIIGIGVNIQPGAESMPEELKDKMIYLYPSGGSPITRAELGARIEKEIETVLAEDFIKEYRSRCFILGSSITVIKNGISRDAVAIDVDDKAALVVRYPDGSIEALSSGEVTLRI